MEDTERSVLCDTHWEQRYVLGMLATTESELLWTTEEDEFQMLVCLQVNDIAMRRHTVAVANLVSEEDHTRYHLEKLELVGRGYLDVIEQRIVHGCPVSFEYNEDGTPASPYQYQYYDAVDIDTTELTTGNGEALEAVSTSTTTGAQLASLDAADAADFLADLHAKKVCDDETRQRLELKRAKRDEYSRLSRQFSEYRDALLRLEVEVLCEHEMRLMSTMTPTEKLLFRLRPATSAEEVQRARLAVEEREEYQRMVTVAVAENSAWAQARAKFLLRAQEIRKSVTDRSVQTLLLQTLHGHRLLRYSEWRLRAKSMAHMRHCKSQIALLAQQQHGAMLKRYCRAWAAVPHRNLCYKWETKLLADQYLDWVNITVSEAEERARNALTLEYDLHRADVTEKFYDFSDKFKAMIRESVIRALVQQSERLLIQTRFRQLERYRVVSRKQKKAQWLLRRSLDRSLAGRFGVWREYAMQRKAHAGERHRLERMATAARNRLVLEEGEQFHRIRDVLAPHDVETAVLWQQRVDSLDHIQHTIVLQSLYYIADENTRLHQLLRFGHWLQWKTYRQKLRKAVALAQKNTELLIGRHYATWCRFNADRAEQHAQVWDCVHSETHARARLSMEEDAFATALELQAVENFTAARLKHRRLFVTEGVRTRMAALGKSCEAALTFLRWVKWQRFVKRRQRLRHLVVVVDHMDCDCELHLMKRYRVQWNAFVDHRNHQRRVAEANRVFGIKSAELVAAETPARDQIESQEQWNFTRTILSFARSKATIRRSELQVQVAAMKLVANETHMRLRFGTWCAALPRRRRLRVSKEVVEVMALKNQAVTLYRFYKSWGRFWWLCQRPKIAEFLQNRHFKVLLRRYFKRLHPGSVRMARVSLAKFNLEQAQRDAKLLENGSGDNQETHPVGAPRVAARSKGAFAVASSRNPFLPPLTAAVPPPIMATMGRSASSVGLDPIGRRASKASSRPSSSSSSRGSKAKSNKLPPLA